MRILVTGGAGFIGSRIVARLATAGHDVVVVDDLDPAAHAGVPDDLCPQVRYLWRDVRDPDTWTTALEGVDAVCHQAAKVGLGVDFTDADAYCSRNVTGTAVLLRALHEQSFRGRLVVASSMVVYGEGRSRCTTHGIVRPGPRAMPDLERGQFEPCCPICSAPVTPERVGEDAPTDPRNVYAVTKLAQEGLAHSFAREHPGTVVTSLRYHNVYGPGMPSGTPYAGVASLFRSAYERGEPPLVFEDGGQRRDFVHVDDVARANVLALTSDTAVDGPMNVCSGEPRTVLELAEAIRPPDAPPPVVTGAYRAGDIRHVFADPTRAAQRLAFVAEVPFSAGMRSFAAAPLRRPAAAWSGGRSRA